MKTKWKVGDVARYVTRTCSRYLILEVCAKKNNWGAQQYCCLSDSGTVCYHNDQDLLTFPEWLTWWERFQDETTGKEYRERAENARKDFVPPVWWNEAVERAKEPLAKPVLTACVDCGETAPETGLTCDGCREDAQGD